MFAKLTAIVGLMVIAVACGGGTPAATTPGSGPTSAPTGGQPSQPVAPGDAIDTAAVSAAIDALQAQESWRFEVSTITMGLEGGVRNDISGVQRTTPERAVDAQHFLDDSGTPFRYVRIGDEIWYDAGTGSFTQVDASAAENLIDQYEPYYLEGLRDSATSQDWTFLPVGTEFINTIEATHYRIDEADIGDMLETLDLTADQWGADVWIATDGGYMVQLVWGPQRPADAGVSTGFFYEAADINCDCPIEPPV